MGATVNCADATRDEQIALEQAFVDRAYRELDSQRKRYRDNQRIAHASQWRGTPQALTERDALSAHAVFPQAEFPAQLFGGDSVRPSVS